MQFVVNSVSRAIEKKFDGRSYLVAPVVMIKAGVLNGVLVSSEEAGKYVASWNGRPVILYHPQDENGEYVSAGTPELNANMTPGQLWNTAFVDGKLSAEIWIDILKATAIGGDALKVMDRLRSNQPVEVSTGYFADHEQSNGTWGGKPYSMIARNIRPDHLALLPDGVGACSWQDGCGTPRTNEAKGMDMEEETPVINEVAAYRVADESFITVLAEKLLSALGRGKHDVLAANADQEDEENDMEKETELKVETITAELVPTVNTAQADVLVNLATAIEKMNQRLDSVDAKLTANADRERNELVATLAVNERCPFDEGELKALSTAHLQKLATAYQPADYSLGAGVVANRDDKFEELAMPAWAVAGKGD